MVGEFFIALLGGIYLLVMFFREHPIHFISSEEEKRRKDKLYNKIIWAGRLKVWQDNVIDKDLQSELYDYVINDRKAAWHAVQEACKKMHFQKSYETMSEWLYEGVLDETKAGKELYCQHRYIEPLSIMLAKRGKLHSEISDSDFKHLDQGVDDTTKLEWDRTVEFWTYIRDELRKQGVDARLLFKYKHNPSYLQYLYPYQDQEQNRDQDKYYDVDDIEKFRYEAGWLTWLPYALVWNDLTPIDV